jgi:hypothetical protein
MTLSRDELVADLKRTLLLMFDEVGDRRISAVFFNVARPELTHIQATTWSVLTDQHYIAPMLNAQIYVLTSRGWAKGLDLRGETASQSLRDKLGQLCASLKKHVKGRARPALVTIQTAATDSKLSDGFIFNAIEAKLIERVLQRKGADWATGFKGSVILVPDTFGQEPITF